MDLTIEIPDENGHPFRFKSVLIFKSLFFASFSDENNEQIARTFGVKGFLMKLVAKGDLATMVRKVLDESKGSSHAYVILL